MDMIELVKVIILGMVEGLTEFAPVSSTGHMIIVDDLWLQSRSFLTEYGANTFKVFIQLGSITAVVIVFKDRFRDMLGSIMGRKQAIKNKLKISHIIVGLLPATILGLLFEDYIDDYLFSTSTVLVGLVVGAALMIVADLISLKTPFTDTVDDMSYRQAFTVGLVQSFSLWPGFSRSGAAISGGVLMGMSHRAAADFTFIMAVPIMFGASFISILNNWSYFTWHALPLFMIGFITAFLFALLSIRFFLRVIQRVKLIPFAVYRIVLAVVVYVLYF
ncbi:undecaprenyl-diphosphate phosphatase [Halobacillus sp. A1]|uniref:undecaprenyl-diphosphate phosphatase n=1 Tax=Halobacillus sp. A1 TaxID=2880262 RepID=UPI0020A65A2C|nr:undecaprenyl-diphosphate phosphatase [Halobacillus sp. A1]MCP3033299.1 undecaprenyl-diphosphate phosphatase [Halobacillus sp. A1]